MTLLSKEIFDRDILALSNMVGGLSMESGPWIAGGCARRLWYGLPWKASDVDLFFPDQASFDDACSLLETLHIKTDVIHADGYSTSLLQTKGPTVTENAKTYLVQIGKIYPNIATVQVVCKQWPATVDDLFDNFDLTVCKFASDGRTVVAKPIAVDDCQSMTLRSEPDSNLMPLAGRIVKYSIYGFEPSREIMFNILRSHRNGSLRDEVVNNDY